MSKKVDFYVPKNLLTTNSYKTIKGEKEGFTTYIMYLAPFTQNSLGVNLCSHASKGCAAACLYQSGNARFNKVQNARINKTNYFLSDKKAFFKQLVLEISKIEIKHTLNNTDFAIRLNGTTDFRFEKFNVQDGKNIFELFSDIQFYDYTKNYLRFDRKIAKNYHLTFSRSETNDNVIEGILNKGINVAVVFTEIPKTYLGREVLNGDKNDLRFLDKTSSNGYIVGLKYKKAAVKGSKNINEDALTSGFVLDTEVLIEKQVAELELV